jgi:hypothetical protein
MELPGSGLFYALAALSMAFVSFTSIVVVLRQATGKPFSPLHILFTRLFCEMGLMATAFAMLAPVLAICGVSEDSLSSFWYHGSLSFQYAGKELLPTRYCRFDFMSSSFSAVSRSSPLV